jgi:hypothetical protein
MYILDLHMAKQMLLLLLLLAPGSAPGSIKHTQLLPVVSSGPTNDTWLLLLLPARGRTPGCINHHLAAATQLQALPPQR